MVARPARCARWRGDAVAQNWLPPRRRDAVRFHQKMVVIAHLPPGVTFPVEALVALSQYPQPDFPVVVQQVNILLSAPRGDVVKTSGKFES